jgi:hypothetical protein
MSSLKRRVAVGLATCAGIVAAGAAPALAEPSTTGDMGACAIDGHANANVNKVGGTGTYNFTSFTADCAASDPTGSETDVFALSITSSGSFSNVVCGTGTADSTTQAIASLGGPGSLPAAIDPDQDGSVTEQVVPELPLKVHYGIVFAGGQGALTVVDTTARPTTHGDGPAGADGVGGNGDDSGGGAISIRFDSSAPPHLSNPADPVCTNGFNVDGAITLLLADA